MSPLPQPHVRALAPLVGRWRTSGTVLDAGGDVVAQIRGTDTYRWLTGGAWLVHEVDVMMGDDHAEALELIGDRDPASGGWLMRAFDASGDFGTMTLTRLDDGTLLAVGDAVRSLLRPAADGGSMTAVWEQERSGTWTRWMDMSFTRLG
ncbi:DUF1579 family protein [Solicola sp. PLA-1-18]|uniref:DUF1579 family protein n=1 Tax=Solicola sp. PLA-1-18 TaxID=3380532 RepID=UPI003B7EC907